MARWKNIKIEDKLIGQPIENNLGLVYCFITLPENDLYENGYGFFISNKLMCEDSILISDDFKVELQMNPVLRDAKKRYKRFKLFGKELMETILLPHMAKLEAKLEAEKARKEAERNRRNKKVFGRIVYGRYLGNTYGEDGDSTCDVYFVRNGIYYNGRDNHEKVENVKIKFVIADNASKYDYEQRVDFLRERIKDWERIDKAVSELREIKSSDERLVSILCQLEECKQNIITEITIGENVQKDIL